MSAKEKLERIRALNVAPSNYFKSAVLRIVDEPEKKSDEGLASKLKKSFGDPTPSVMKKTPVRKKKVTE